MSQLCAIPESYIISLAMHLVISLYFAHEVLVCCMCQSVVLVLYNTFMLWYVMFLYVGPVLWIWLAIFYEAVI